MLKQRIITASVLAPIVLAGVFFLPVQGFAIFFGVVVMLGAWEWAALSQLSTSFQRISYSMVFVPLLLVCGYYFDSSLVRSISYVAMVFWLFAFVWIVRYPGTCLWSSRVSRTLLGVVFLLAFWLSLVQLKSLELGNQWLLQLLLIVWSADVGAYFAGRRFGKRKLAPNVSPGKTWEGVIGGAVTVALVSVLFASIMELNASALVYFVVLSLVVGLLSVMGDLFESMLKRHVGMKDSGTILPGHGGVLDRIDSLLVAAPFFALGLTFLPIL